MSKTISEWMVEIAKEADDKGFWDPQCLHTSAKTTGHGLYAITWCDVCGGYTTDQGKHWELPIKARERNKGEVYMLFVSEVAEAFEEYRSGHGIDEVYYSLGLSPLKPEGQPVEIADIVIRIFDFCAHMGIDLEAVMEEKFAYNKTRSHRHGGKLA